MNDNKGVMNEKVSSVCDHEGTIEKETLNQSFTDYTYIPISEMFTPMDNYIEDNPPVEVYSSPETDYFYQHTNLSIGSCPNFIQNKKKFRMLGKKLHIKNPSFSQESGLRKRSKSYKNVFMDITNVANIPSLEPFTSSSNQENYFNQPLDNQKLIYHHHHLLNEKCSPSLSSLSSCRSSLKETIKKCQSGYSDYSHVAINLSIISMDPFFCFKRDPTLKQSVFNDVGMKIDLLLNHSLSHSCYTFNREINSARIKLVEWIFDFVYTYECSLECAFMSVQVVDLFISLYLDDIPRSKYQMYAVASLLIFSKLFDIKPVSVTECVYTTCDQYTIDEVLDAELLLFQQPKINLFNLSLVNYIEVFYTKFLFHLHKSDHTLVFLTLSEMILMSPTILECYNFLDISLAIICIAVEKNPNLCINELKFDINEFHSDCKKIVSCALDICKTIRNFDFTFCASTKSRYSDFL